MTANIYRNLNKKGLGIPNLRSRQNAAIFLRRRYFFGASEKTVRSVFAVKVADFAQYWSGAEILFCSVALRLTKQVLGKLYPFCQNGYAKPRK